MCHITVLDLTSSVAISSSPYCCTPEAGLLADYHIEPKLWRLIFNVVLRASLKEGQPPQSRVLPLAASKRTLCTRTGVDGLSEEMQGVRGSPLFSELSHCYHHMQAEKAKEDRKEVIEEERNVNRDIQ